MLATVGIEPGPLISSDSKSNTNSNGYRGMTVYLHSVTEQMNS